MEEKGCLVVFERTDYKTNESTVQTKVLVDPRLSWKAKGLYSVIHMMGESWCFDFDDLKAFSNDGTTSTSNGLKELEEHGYLTRKRIKNEAGKFTGSLWILKV